MGLETGTYISALVATNPVSGDPKAEGDNHLRLVKSTLLATFPNITGAMNSTHTQLNYLASATGTTGTTSTNLVFSTSPVLTTPNIGTPSAGTLTSCTGLPVSTGISGLGTGVATALAVNTGSAGAFVILGGALGTPSSGTLTSCTGLPISSGVSGLGTSVATALAVNVGTDGAFVVKGGALGSPSSAGTLPAFTLGGTVTLNGQSFSGTCANGGTFTTIDINGGTLDGVVIGGSATAAASVTTLTTSSTATIGGNTAITGTLTASNQIYSTGANTAHGASRILMEQESAAVSAITAYGTNASTNGALQIRSRRSDGSNAYTHTFNADGTVSLTGNTAITGTLSATVSVNMPSYTVAGLPSAATAGATIYVSNETGGAVLAFADGTNWRRVTDRAVVS